MSAQPSTGPLVAGVDSSTQACKVVVRDDGTGALVRSGRAAHAPRRHRGRPGRLVVGAA
jgi:sugar (pentulose or hexulose) kinase